MTDNLIPQFNQRLQDFRAYFITESQGFSSHVKVSTERFTSQDRLDFNVQILAEIRQFALEKFVNFINSRIETKTSTFTHFFNQFEANADNLENDLGYFKSELEEASRKLKEREIEGENMLERITSRYAYTQSLKKGFRAFKANAQESLKQKRIQAQMIHHYEQKLMQKCFFPWRALTYKDGYENSIKRQTEVQFRKIHSQFGAILEVLKQKIAETEQLIKVKRAAKGEFAYALSKNLLKTISNLSLQVMSLNQVASKQKESHYQTQNFLNQVNKEINARLQSVTIYKQSMYESELPVFNRQNVQIQEPRQIPQQISSPKTRTKKISFA